MPDAIEELLPHRAPMRWVDALLECTDTFAIATARIGPEHFAVENGALLETALVECAAQTCAVALGHRMRASGQHAAANKGMLVGVSNFRIATRPSAGQTLTIEIQEVKRLGPMLLVAATITCEGEFVATGELTLYA
jgi:predicted hotdog family 3-hydroxylacyl-ACP dehydratase